MEVEQLGKVVVLPGFGKHYVDFTGAYSIKQHPGLYDWIMQQVLPDFEQHAESVQNGHYPSVVRIDCAPTKKGEFGLYEVEERPCGLGLMHLLCNTLGEQDMFTEHDISRKIAVVYTESRTREGVLFTDDAGVPGFTLLRLESTRNFERKLREYNQIIFRYKQAEEVGLFEEITKRLPKEVGLFFPLEEADKRWMVPAGHAFASIPAMREVTWPSLNAKIEPEIFFFGYCKKAAGMGIKELVFKPARSTRSFGVCFFDPGNTAQVRKIARMIRSQPYGAVLQKPWRWENRFYGTKRPAILRLYLCRSGGQWHLPKVCGVRMIETDENASLVHGTETALSVPLLRE